MKLGKIANRLLLPSFVVTAVYRRKFSCVITDGVTIGHHCIVARNLLATHNLPARTVAMGQPARKIIERW